MEPVTHILTGACLARTGFNRRAAYATFTMAVAAEFPDIDTLWSLRGPVEGFQHHRGITHTFLGLPIEAALIVAAVYGLHRWRVARAAKTAARLPPDASRPAKPLTLAPVRWGVLYGLALLALLTHLLLDYTNNYGLRPFFPFDDRWYAASIVFIVDPAILALLLIGLVAPALFALIGSEVGAKRPLFRGRGWATAAIIGVLGLWMLRSVEHGRAMDLAMAQSIAAPLPTAPLPAGSDDLGPEAAPDAPPEIAPTYIQPQRVLATPDPLNPFHWSTVTDFGPLYQVAEIDTRNGALTPAQASYPKPARDRDILLAEHSPLGRAYIDWSPMPIVDVTRSDSGLATAPTTSPSATVVTFRDPRFMGGWLRDMGRSALTGTVTINAKGQVVQQAMDGRVER
jgi:inner membrane protein